MRSRKIVPKAGQTQDTLSPENLRRAILSTQAFALKLQERIERLEFLAPSRSSKRALAQRGRNLQQGVLTLQ
jgi:hypothetical protein